MPINKERKRKRYAERLAAYPKDLKAESMLYGCRHTARQHNFPCDITKQDILAVFPDRCPVLGLPFDYSPGPSTALSPSLDKFYPELGYIKGNIHVISHLANAIKANGSFEDVRKVADWMEIKEKELAPLVDKWKYPQL